MNEPIEQPPAARFLISVFGLVFLGIGLTVLGFLWFGDDGFGAPPLVFRLFGSFIAIAFVAMGGSMAASGIFGTAMPGARVHLDHGAAGGGGATTVAPAAGYTCPHCGAAPGDKAEVSPLGDCRCAFCGRWFNVHGRS